MNKFWLTGVVFILIGWCGYPASGQDEAPQIFFVSITGSPSSPSDPVPVLLRWYASTDDIPLRRFSLYRKNGAADSASPFEALTLTAKLREPALIRSILEHPQNQRALDDLFGLLDEIYEEPVTLESYAEQLIRILNGEKVCDTCTLRTNMLIQANYAVAVIEGWGYLDLVSPSTFTYELRATDGTPGSEQIIGRITVDARTPTLLPAPQQPVFVDVPGERGHEKVYLKWDIGDPLEEQRSAMFGYNVYRGEGDLSGIPFDELMELGALRQINQVPILPPSENAVSGDESNAYFFRDDNQILTGQGIEGEPFSAGEVYTYWVAARDLLGQNGQISQPLVVTVPDKQAPQIPEDVQIKPIETPGGDRLFLTWRRNSDDALRYNIYRFRQYNHVGHREPLAPIDGLTEGLIGVTDQPAAGAPAYQDDGIQRPQHENKAFWYTVSAVDAWGNESFQSSPVRGVLFDETPPDPPTTGQICLYQTVCDIQNVAVETEPGDGEQFQIIIQVKTHSSMLDNLTIVREVDQDIASHVQMPLLQTLHRGPFDDQGQVTVSDGFNLSDVKRLPQYHIRSGQGERAICQLTLPYQEHLPAYVEQIYTKGLLIYTIDLSTQMEPVCMPFQTRTEPHVSVDEGGNIIPVVLQFQRETEDARRIILYRSPNCQDFYVVGQADYGENGEVQIEDDYSPQQGGRVCYAVRAVDENDNQSILMYIPTEVAVAPAGETIRPSMQAAVPAGDATSPSVLVKWFSPANGLSHFRLYFCSENQFDETAPNKSLTSNQYILDEETSIFQSVISSIQDGEYRPPEINQTYYIFCKAYMQSGEERISLNSVLLNWSAALDPGEHPAWPSRSLPPETGGLVVTLFEYNSASPDPNRQGVGIFMGEKVSLFQNYNYVLDFPFQVFRRRVDKPGYSFVQVSPLLETVRRGIEGENIDPFFLEITPQISSHVDPNQNSSLYFLDRFNLIKGAKYEYKIVLLDSNNGEIKEVRGPSQPIEVTN
ncbi:MAG: hypothetical protein ACP5I1_00295 [Candidatus Hinthialibacter sp.]